MNSDIFNEYAKIAIKKGLVKKAQEKTNPRYDSQDLSTIEMLYGVKPDGEGKDILDEAHPEPVVIAPAYDKQNALVENLKERQSIMTDIALKPNDGKITHKRYIKANYELVQELTKIGFLLDRKGEEELMRLADNCSSRLVQKTAGVWAVLAPALPYILGAAAIAAPFIIANTSLVLGVKQNAEKALEDIYELFEDNYIPGIEDELQRLILLLERLIKVATLAESIKLSSVDLDDKNDNVKEKVEKVKGNLTKLYKQHAFKILNYYEKVCKHAINIIPRYISLINQRTEEAQGKEWYSIMYRKVWHAIYQSPAEDVTDELEALQEAAINNLKYIHKHRNLLGLLGEEQKTMAQVDKALEIAEKEGEKLSSLMSGNVKELNIEKETGSKESELDKLKME